MKRRDFLCHALVLMACGPAWSQEGRASQPAFKGMELYSWSRQGDWCYALLPGTNRNKSWPELEVAAIGEAELRRRLQRLAVGEYLSWLNQCQDAPQGALSYPPTGTLQPLVDLCERLEIHLFLATKS